MVSLPTIKMTSMGQLVIPASVLRRVGMAKGGRFLVIEQGDALTLKSVRPAERQDIGAMLEETRKAARRAGIKRSDITAAIKRVRASARNGKRNEA